jgi:pimeloyl-ACP methyl ester carboxylesterase
MRLLLAALALAVAAGPLPAQGAPRTYVLVHGGWGGGWAFRALDSLLTAAGHRVYRPTLTGLGERMHLATSEVGLSTHVTDIVNVLLFENLRDVVLVGHSYGGMVITGGADRVPERIRHLVYVDAFVPEDGESVVTASRGTRLEGFARRSVDNLGRGADEHPGMVSIPAFFGTAIVAGFRSYFFYTVQRGDTLSGIAASQSPPYIGTGWQPIFEANRHIISDPDLIHPGMVLRLPSDF